MAQRTIQLSEDMYQLLLRHADRLQTTPERVLERLLAHDLTSILGRCDGDETMPACLSDPAEALMAVQRLTTLFADVTLPDLDAMLDDPTMRLAN